MPDTQPQFDPGAGYSPVVFDPGSTYSAAPAQPPQSKSFSDYVSDFGKHFATGIENATGPFLKASAPNVALQLYRKVQGQPNTLNDIPENAVTAFLSTGGFEGESALESETPSASQPSPTAQASNTAKATEILNHPAMKPWVDALKADAMKFPGANLARTIYQSARGAMEGTPEATPPAPTTPGVPETNGIPWGTAGPGPLELRGKTIPTQPSFPGAPLPEHPGTFPGAPEPAAPPQELLQGNALAKTKPQPPAEAASLGTIPAASFDPNAAYEPIFPGASLPGKPPQELLQGNALAKSAPQPPPESAALGAVPVAPATTSTLATPGEELPVPEPGAGASLPRTLSGESALRQVLTGQDNVNLLKIARSRGVNVSAEAQLKPGVADNRIINKIIDDFSDDELDNLRSTFMQNQSKHQFGDVGPEAWKTMSMQTYFPDVKIPQATLNRVAKVLNPPDTASGTAPGDDLTALLQKSLDAVKKSAAAHPEGITDFNKVGTAQMTPAERAIADSHAVSQGTLDNLAGKLESAGKDATLADVLQGKSGSDVLDRLIDDGVVSPQERAALANENGLTPAGKERISKLVVGRFFRDTAQMDSTPPAIRGKLEAIAAPLARVDGVPGWDLTQHIQGALDLLEEAGAHNIGNVDDVVAQQGFFGNQKYSPEAVEVAHLLKDNSGRTLAKLFRQYAQDAQDATGAQSTLGQPVAPAQAFSDAFRAKKSTQP